MAAADEPSCTVGALKKSNVTLLEAAGVTLESISPLGASVRGLDLRTKPSDEVLGALQTEMATRGYLVFKGQGVLSGEEQVAASEYWGGRRIHSTHGVHPKAPDKHIFRLSNDRAHGIPGVGPQWHNDGSFERGVFSHVGYHIIRVPENGGGTVLAHQGAAFDALPPADQERWQRLVSVNSNSGVLHPVVRSHPISKRKSVYLHLGMTGAVLECFPDREGPEERVRLLEEAGMRAFLSAYNDLLNAGFADRTRAPYTDVYHYEEGDLVVIDNLAVAHRAAPEAHESAGKQGLRILHRTTVRAMENFDPPFGLPPALDINGRNPTGQGVWQGGGIGFRWGEQIRMQN